MTMTMAAPGCYETPGIAYDGVLYGELTADGSQIVLIAEGNDWGIDQIGTKLRKLTPLLESPVDADGQKIKGPLLCPATWAAVVQLGFTFNNLHGLAWVPQPRLLDWITAEAARRTSPSQPLEPSWPPWLAPRPYQAEGAAMIADEGKFLLMDEPGTGKTLVALLGIDGRRLRGLNIFPMVIIVPSWDVADHWAREIAIWVPQWGIPRMHGGPDRVQGLTARNRDQYARDVFITTYATARRDAADMRGPLVQLQAATVIADEVHLCRNSSAKQTLAVQRIARHAATMAGLSGTPITRNTGDVHPVLAAMDPLSWPSRERFTRRFCEHIEGDYDETVLGLNPARTGEFFAIMDRQMRRVAKADVLDQLPPKIYSVRRPEVPAEWLKAYRSMETAMLAELPDGGELPVMDTLSQLTRLTQLASSAADVEIEQVLDEETGLLVPKYHVKLKPPSWKAESLMEIIAERPGMPVVAFMASRQLAMITGQHYCEKAGLRTGYITGTGGGITRATRQQAVTDFQAGKLDVVVCTAGAGSLGITLTRSDTCVLLQRPWQFDQAVQPEDRVHRIGAEIHDKVEIIDIVAKGTVDERVRELLREKAGQFSQFVRDARIVRELLGGRR